MPHKSPRYEPREKGAVMHYWFPRGSFVLLVGAVAFAALGFIIELDPHPYPLRWGVHLTAVGFLLASAAAVSRRRFAVIRFKWIFGFLPSRSGRFSPLVEKEIRRRARSLRVTYREKDKAEKLTYMSGDDWPNVCRQVAEIHRRRFYRAIDAATSKNLPTPYQGISRNLENWAPKPQIAQITHPS